MGFESNVRWRFEEVFIQQNRELGDLDDDELVEEVEQYAPELVNWVLKCPSIK